MNQQTNNQSSQPNQSMELKCPKCEHIIPLNEANFCGSCGVDITPIKQQIYYQQLTQQSYQFQQMQHQQYYNYPNNPMSSHMYPHMHQQMRYPQNPISKKDASKQAWLKFIRINLIILIIIISVILMLAMVLRATNGGSILYGVDDSLFYNYFAPESNDVTIQDYFFPGGISYDEYHKLENGMSYALASFIIGGDGDLVNSGENIQNKIYYTYRWYSESSEDILYFITFVEDAISEIMVDQQA